MWHLEVRYRGKSGDSVYLLIWIESLVGLKVALGTIPVHAIKDPAIKNC